MQVCDHYNNFSACEEKQKDFTTGNADLMKVKYGTWRRERKRPRKQGSVLCSKKYNNYHKTLWLGLGQAFSGLGFGEGLRMCGLGLILIFCCLLVVVFYNIAISYELHTKYELLGCA